MKKNIAGQFVGAQLINATTGAAFTGAVAVYVTGNGGVQAVGSVGAGACVHEGNGFHTYAPAQAETAFDHVAFTFIGTGAVPATVQVYPSTLKTDVVTFGTAQAATVASITLAAAAASTNGTYDPAVVMISGGTGVGQSRFIIQYDGATRVASVDRDWRVVPDATSEYQIVASANLLSTNEGLAQAGGASTITLNASASAIDDTYVGQTVVLRTGTGQDQSRLVSAYNGTTKVATMSGAWTTVPAAGTGYIMNPLGRTRTVAVEPGAITATSFAAGAIDAAALADGAIDRATFSVDSGLQTMRSGTAQLGAATTITLDAGASAVTGFYQNALIVLTGGTGAGQSRYITAYNGATKIATVSAWATVPGVTSTFSILVGDAIVGATAPTAVQVADEVQTRTIAAVTTVNGLAANIITAAATAADFTAEVTAGLSTLTQAGVRTAVGLAAANLDTQLTAIDDFLDTEVLAIKARTDLIPAAPAAVGDIPTAAVITSAVLDKALSAHTTVGSLGAAVRDADLRGSRTVVRGTVGTATAPSATQFTPSALSPAGAAADQFKGRIIVWDNDTATLALRGQATDITASSAAALPLLTFTALTTAPVSGDTFSVL